MSENLAVCPVCFRQKSLKEGERAGILRRKKGKRAGRWLSATPTGGADSACPGPIGKKPFARFHPGNPLWSLWGATAGNLTCPFCQNYEISRKRNSLGTTNISPEKLLAIVTKANREDERTIGAPTPTTSR